MLITKHRKLFQSILDAVESGRLIEPFNAADFEKACTGFAENTYSVFLPKHAKDNPGGTTELFIRVRTGMYPIKLDAK